MSKRHEELTTKISLFESRITFNLLEGRISVTKEFSPIYGDVTPAYVNWNSGIFAQKDEAGEFASTLQDAVALAHQLNLTIKSKEDFKLIYLEIKPKLTRILVTEEMNRDRERFILIEAPVMPYYGSFAETYNPLQEGS